MITLFNEDGAWTVSSEEEAAELLADLHERGRADRITVGRMPLDQQERIVAAAHDIIQEREQ